MGWGDGLTNCTIFRKSGIWSAPQVMIAQAFQQIAPMFVNQAAFRASGSRLNAGTGRKSERSDDFRAWHRPMFVGSEHHTLLNGRLRSQNGEPLVNKRQDAKSLYVCYGHSLRPPYGRQSWPSHGLLRNSVSQGVYFFHPAKQLHVGVPGSLRQIRVVCVLLS